MAHGKSDAEMIQSAHPTARFFVENRHVSWVLLIAVILWGIYGYNSMPQRKDPDIPIRVAVAMIPWPGVNAEKVDQLVTGKIEEKVAENPKVVKIESISRTGLAVVFFELDKRVAETGREFDDIQLKLNSIHDLPEGAGPVRFIKDFGDTASLMLTVASPPVGSVEVALRAKAVQQAIEQVRSQATPQRAEPRFALVIGLPQTINPLLIRGMVELFTGYLIEHKAAHDLHRVEGDGFIILDGASDLSDVQLLAYTQKFIQERLQAAESHPDIWPPVLVRAPEEAEAKLRLVAGAKYSYRKIDDFTLYIEKALKAVPLVSKVTRAGVLDEKVFLLYSQERLASYGLQPAMLPDILKARNIAMPGGVFNIEDKRLIIEPSGEFKNEREIADVLLTTAVGGGTVYLRDLFDIVRTYESPPHYLNFYTWRDAQGTWHRTRAITLAIQMRAGEKIGDFGKAVEAALTEVRTRLPEDLVMAPTSNQPQQVKENVGLFMNSLYEAILLVVVVSLIGFWEWRSALLMALAIPLTLAMTFGMMSVLGIDLQQISIATLIIALGLLVDDPVVAGDAIKRDLALGHPPSIAAWLGPTKLATAILYATITNIVAYLPFLLLSGDAGRFIYSLPVVMTCALVASRLVSMTFIPLLGYYLLRPKHEPSRAERRQRGFAAFYYKVGTFAIAHRWSVLGASLVFLVVGGYLLTQLRPQFFPKDQSYLSYVDVWLPEDAQILSTDAAARQAERIIQEVVAAFGKEHPAPDGTPRQVLESLTTFVGGSGPRFWFSVTPELLQVNYAQIIMQVKDKHDTQHLAGLLQQALSAGIAGARVDVRQLETGSPVGIPVSIRLSGEDISTLRTLAEQVKDIFRAIPLVTRIRDDWGKESLAIQLRIDPDRANLAGVSNLDVAGSSVAGLAGVQVTTLREGDRQIPVIARLRTEERAQLEDLQNLYVYSTQGPQRVPLRQVASIDYQLRLEKMRRRNQFPTITASGFPLEGVLPSEVMNLARPRLTALAKTLPPGYRMEVGGEEEEQVKGFTELAIVLGISVAMIFLALVFQFKHAIKPFLVFAAIPYGMVGAFAALWIMNAPFGFIAFLGIISLIGVIVSHVIVLFDFIEEMHAEGEPLTEALLDAGIMRLRPVLITVGATVTALFPLAAHGGPLWEPLCYAQIGGLLVATFITLLLVPVLYAIFVLDLRLVHWAAPETHSKIDRAETVLQSSPMPPERASESE